MVHTVRRDIPPIDSVPRFRARSDRSRSARPRFRIPPPVAATIPRSPRCRDVPFRASGSCRHPAAPAGSSGSRRCHGTTRIHDAVGRWTGPLKGPSKTRLTGMSPMPWQVGQLALFPAASSWLARPLPRQSGQMSMGGPPSVLRTIWASPFAHHGSWAVDRQSRCPPCCIHNVTNDQRWMGADSGNLTRSGYTTCDARSRPAEPKSSEPLSKRPAGECVTVDTRCSCSATTRCVGAARDPRRRASVHTGSIGGGSRAIRNGRSGRCRATDYPECPNSRPAR